MMLVLKYSRLVSAGCVFFLTSTRWFLMYYFLLIWQLRFFIWKIRRARWYYK